MSDDHTTQAIGVYGSRLAELDPTPTIDVLAKNGMRFDRVFCNNSICTPSRASIVTGQYSQRNGVLDLSGKLQPEKQYLPQEMKKAGYQTAMIGKWHLKQEPATFDYYCVLPGQRKYFDPVFRVRGPKPWMENTIKQEGKHSSDAITDLGIEWLSHGWNREKPFFVMHHFKAPHDMFQNAPHYDSYLEEVEIPEPANMRRLPPSGLGSGLTKGHEQWQLGKKLKVLFRLSNAIGMHKMGRRYTIAEQASSTQPMEYPPCRSVMNRPVGNSCGRLLPCSVPRCLAVQPAERLALRVRTNAQGSA